MKTFKIMSIALSLMFAVTFAAEAVAINEAAPNFTLEDSAGAEHSLSDFAGKFVVLEWVNFDCPFVVKHYSSGNMQSLQKKAKSDGVVWLSINSSADGKQGCFTDEEVTQKIDERSAEPTAYLQDTSGDVGRLYAAQTTPHMYIINPEGKLIYQGAIDDNPSWDPGVIATSKNYITSSLEAALEGHPVPTPSTKSYGCSVKY